MNWRRRGDKVLAGALVAIGSIISYGAYKLLSAGKEEAEKDKSVIER